MPDEPLKLVYDQAVTGLFRIGLGDRFTPLLDERLRALGVDLNRLLPAYPRATWHAMLQLAREAFPELSDDDAYFTIGQRFVRGTASTTLGRAIATMMKVIGPRRSLDRLRRATQRTNNYLSTSFREESDGSLLFFFGESAVHPAYYRGIVATVLSISGAPNAEVATDHRDEQGVTLRIRVSPKVH